MNPHTPTPDKQTNTTPKTNPRLTTRAPLPRRAKWPGLAALLVAVALLVQSVPAAGGAMANRASPTPAVALSAEADGAGDTPQATPVPANEAPAGDETTPAADSGTPADSDTGDTDGTGNAGANPDDPTGGEAPTSLPEAPEAPNPPDGGEESTPIPEPATSGPSTEAGPEPEPETQPETPPASEAASEAGHDESAPAPPSQAEPTTGTNPEAATGSTPASNPGDTTSEPAPETESAPSQSQPAAAPAAGTVPGAGFSPIAPLAEIINNTDIRTILQDLIDAGAPDVNSTSILTGMDLEFTDGDGNPVSPDDVHVGDYFRLNFDFAIPPSLFEVLGAGDYYDITPPAGFEIFEASQDAPYVITTPDGTVVADILVQPDGTLRILFNENIENKDQVLSTGSFFVSGQVTDEITDEGGTTTITVPGEEDVPGVTVTVKPDIESTVDKSGYFDRETNPTGITWDVYANKTVDTLTNVTLTDTLPAGTALDEVTVYRCRVDLAGNIIPGSDVELVEGTDYTVSEVGGVVTITWLTDVTYPIHVNYVTTIDEGAKPEGAEATFTNDVTLDATELGTGGLDGEASVAGYWNSRLEKEFTSYNPETRELTWTVRFNYRQDELPAGFTLSDTIADGLTLVPGSVYLQAMGYDANGNLSPLNPNPIEEGVNYTVDETTNPFTIEIVEPVPFTYPVLITYRTVVDDIINVDTTFPNTIIDSDGNTSTGNGNAIQQGVIKSHVVNPVDKIITWTVRINGNNYEMTDFSLVDTLSPGLTLTGRPEDLVITTAGDEDGSGAGVVLQQGVDYNATQSTPTLSVDFLATGGYNPTTQSFTITYKTTYDGTAVPDEGYFFNTATSSWEDENGNPQGSTDTDRYTPSDEEAENGAKVGEYNAVTKEITWVIRLNYNDIELLNAYIEDTIDPEQSYVDGSLSIYTYTIAANGAPQRGTGLDLDDFTHTLPDDGNNQTFRIEFPDTNAAEDTYYWIEYRTGFDGALIGSDTYYNTASWRNDASPPFDLEADVSVANGGEYIGKQGYRGEDGFVHWSIVVNASQSTLNNVVVTDVPSANQIVDPESVRVYGTSITPAGEITPDTSTVLTLDEDYTVSYEANPQGQFELDVAFINGYATIDTAYIIDFRVTVQADENAGPQVNLSNDVTIRGDNEVVVQQPGDSEFGVNVGSGGGFIVGAVSVITIQKLDSLTGLPIPGVTFQLYYDEDGAIGEDAFPPVTTGPNGTATYPSLVQGWYWLEEVSAPEGYGIPTDNPRRVHLTSSSTTFTFTVTNTPSFINLTKVDADGGAPLAGATYTLWRQNAAGEYQRIRANETFRTGASGRIQIRNLDAGSYYLLEQAAPAGYARDTDPIYFTVAPDADGTLVATYTGNNNGTGNGTNSFIHPNRLTSVTIHKWDEDGPGGGNPLAGASFILQQLIDGEWVQLNVGTFYTSDGDGLIQIDGLPLGSYRVIEVSAPEGYARHTDPLEFTIGPDSDGNEEYFIERDFTNYPIIVILEKVDINTRARLAGAIFELWEYDELTGWQRIRERETFYTDEAGILTIGNMFVGVQYELREVIPPAGYNLINEPISIELELDDVDEIIVFDVGEYENTPGDVGVVKTDAATGAPLEGAVFRLDVYDDEAGEWASYSEATAALATDVNGGITLNALPTGRYRLVETAAPAGYLLNDDPFEFTVETDAEGQIIPVRLEISNTPNQTTLQKQDETGAPLAGAAFRLERYDTTAAAWAQYPTAAPLTTGPDGLITLPALAPGRYRLIETEAPTGYLLDPTPVEFTIQPLAEGNLTLPPLVNTPTLATATKVDDTGAPLAGAQFRLEAYSYEQDTWTEMPTEAPLVSGEDGAITLTGLAPGRYRLVETAAPAGYLLGDTPTVFLIEEGETAPLTIGDIINYPEEIPGPGPEPEPEPEPEPQPPRGYPPFRWRPGGTGGNGEAGGTGSGGTLAATGDSTTNPALWILLAAAAIAVILAVLIYRRQRGGAGKRGGRGKR